MRGRKETAADWAFEKPREDYPPGAQRMVGSDYSGSCTRPVRMRYDRAVDHDFKVRCRNCPSCLRSRQFLWQMRAEAETLLAPLTWMFTGTFDPKRFDSFDMGVVKRETDLFLMRLRSRCHDRGTNFRYSVFPERHKSGAWHIHSLIHARDSGCSYRLVDESWTAGFSNVQECDFRSAGYVTKYCAKELFEILDGKRPRIRASRAPTYGAWVMEKDAEVLKEMMQNKPEERIFETWQKNLRMLVRKLESPVHPQRQMLEVLTYGPNKVLT